jgi:uncharacterized protein YggE
MTILLGALLLIVTPTALRGQERDTRPQPPTLQVTGIGIVDREPERANVLLAVESLESTARQASQANATKMDAVMAALRGLGITPPRVKTISYYLQPEYASERGGREPRIVGYRAVNMVQVRVDTITRVGAVIDGAIGAGANRVANLSFELRDPDAAWLEAHRIAISKARAQAEVVAAAAGQRLGPPLTIHTSPQEIPYERFRVLRATATMAPPPAPPPPTPIEPGMVTSIARVTITYRLDQP